MNSNHYRQGQAAHLQLTQFPSRQYVESAPVGRNVLSPEIRPLGDQWAFWFG